jgi:hypothetical protein
MDGENKGLIVDRREADPEHPQKYARVIPQDRPLIYPNIPEPAETAAANLPSGWSASDADALWSARTYVTR